MKSGCKRASPGAVHATFHAAPLPTLLPGWVRRGRRGRGARHCAARRAGTAAVELLLLVKQAAPFVLMIDTLWWPAARHYWRHAPDKHPARFSAPLLASTLMCTSPHSLLLSTMHLLLTSHAANSPRLCYVTVVPHAFLYITWQKELLVKQEATQRDRTAAASQQNGGRPIKCALKQITWAAETKGSRPVAHGMACAGRHGGRQSEVRWYAFCIRCNKRAVGRACLHRQRVTRRAQRLWGRACGSGARGGLAPTPSCPAGPRRRRLRAACPAPWAPAWSPPWTWRTRCGGGGVAGGRAGGW